MESGKGCDNKSLQERSNKSTFERQLDAEK